MKIEDRKPMSRAAGAHARAEGPVRTAVKESPAPAPAAAIPDNLSVMGIPEAELTPKVRAAIVALMGEVDRLRRELEHSKKKFDELERFANLDPLVPVLNRRAFVRELSRIISFADRYKMSASLIYFDLNNFKEVNDRLGHGAGDEALKQVAEIISTNVRESDAVGRLGGDEFGVVLANANDDVTQKKAESLAELIEKASITWNGVPIKLSLAYGIYTFRPGEDPAEALAHADRAMFKHKRNKKNDG
jgi:diguanylate cyclase (GGDEF)-like protein